jgi:hypothetical protein
MGPTVLFDKSFLQSLTVDESVLFDQFFIPVICPIFYVETLADLEKAVRVGRTPEQEVGIIARKTPEMNSMPCAHHLGLCTDNLMGRQLSMDGRVPRVGGKAVKVHGQSGIVYDESPEEQAFLRWQNGEFLEVERRFAKRWRNHLNSMDFLTVASAMRAMGIDSQKCKTLEDARRLADAFVVNTERPLDKLKLMAIAFGFPSRLEPVMAERWKQCDFAPLLQFAPFAAHMLTAELFFQIAIAANVPSVHLSDRTDVSYLFYLPFCRIFVSSDRLHERIAPLFLRPHQSFVWGQDLKADLYGLVERYKGLSDIEREQGVMNFARTPPEEGEWFVTQLWDRHAKSWRAKAKESSRLHPVRDRQLIDALSDLVHAPAVPTDQVESDPAKIMQVTFERRIHKAKGSFWQIPKDMAENSG